MLKRKRPTWFFLALLAPATALGQTPEKASGAPPSPHPIIDELKSKGLLLPIPGVARDKLRDSFRDKRGERVHHAVDILAPRGTAVLSTDSGQIIKLHRSKAGGITIYAVDATRKFIYYYAHLDRYHPRMAEGLKVARGDTIGFVGTTGNAPPNHPHLHFAIMRSYNIARWSKGLPVNPAKVF